MNKNILLDKLEGVYQKFEEISEKIIDPEIISDIKQYIKLNKEYKSLEPLINSYKKYKKVLSNISFSREILREEKDEEMKEMAKMELDELNEKKEILEKRIKIQLLPSDPEDAKNAIMEIRAGTGGDEASIFAGDLFRMYIKFCEDKKWKVNVNSFSGGTSGGYKEVVMSVRGANVYGILKYESGVHRVQRVPQTETQGRVHTSAASIAVLPEAEEFDVEIKQEDIRKDTYCSLSRSKVPIKKSR